MFQVWPGLFHRVTRKEESLRILISFTSSYCFHGGLNFKKFWVPSLLCVLTFLFLLRVVLFTSITIKDPLIPSLFFPVFTHEYTAKEISSFSFHIFLCSNPFCSRENSHLVYPQIYILSFEAFRFPFTCASLICFHISFMQWCFWLLFNSLSSSCAVPYFFLPLFSFLHTKFSSFFNYISQPCALVWILFLVKRHYPFSF